MGAAMRRFVEITAILSAAFAVFAQAEPAHAQALAIQAPTIPVAGEHDLRIGYGERDSVVCVGAENSPRPGVTPYVHGENCRRSTVFTVRFVDRNRVTLELDRSGNCATVARGVLIGPPSIDILPCTNAMDQQFSLITVGGNVISIQGPGGCWTARNESYVNNDIVEERCEGQLSQSFRVIDAAPQADTGPAIVVTAAPPESASTPALPVARPVTPPPVTVPDRVAPGTFVPVRPAGLPDNMPAPAEYFMTPGGMGHDEDCYRLIGGGGVMSVRIGERGCVDVPEQTVRLVYTGTRGFHLQIYPNRDRPGCFSTAQRRWITQDTCAPIPEHIFQVIRADYPGYYVIKTQTGLCLTQRGAKNDDPAMNNSALFPEPCREAPEQYFKLRPLRQYR